MHLVFVGGTKFIGHAAAQDAHARGHAVTVLHRGVTRAELPFAREVHADRNNPSALALALAKAKPDVVVDTRAMTRADAECTALAIKMLRVPVVVLSSQDVYAQFGRVNGLPAPEPELRVREDSPKTIPRPFTTIGGHEGGADYDKNEVEAVFRDLATEARVSAIALRLPAVYGPRDPKRRFGVFVDAIDHGTTEFPRASGPSLRLTHVHVRDAARAIVLAAERRGAFGFEAFNVGEPQTPTMLERVENIARAMDRAITFVETSGDVPDRFGILGAFPNDCVMDTSRIRSALAFSEVLTKEEAVVDLVAWLRASRARFN